jgi:hypothetical protein
MKNKRQVGDLSGKTFGRWTVVEQADRNEFGHIFYWCVCACGYKARVIAHTLRRGTSKSCGCWQRELSAEMMKDVRKLTKNYLRKQIRDLEKEVKYLKGLLAEKGIKYHSAVAS